MEINKDTRERLVLPVEDTTQAQPTSVNITQVAGSSTSAVPVAVVSGSTGGGAVTVANGADTAEGATTDAAVTGDSNGTISAKLRGLLKIVTDVWDSVAHKLNVAVASVPNPPNLDVAASTLAKDSSLAILDADLKSSQPRAVTQTTSPWATQDVAVGTVDVTAPNYAAQIGGVNGAILRPIAVDANGRLYLSDTGEHVAMLRMILFELKAIKLILLEQDPRLLADDFEGEKLLADA